jgi:hypothetical protein
MIIIYFVFLSNMVILSLISDTNFTSYYASDVSRAEMPRDTEVQRESDREIYLKLAESRKIGRLLLLTAARIQKKRERLGPIEIIYISRALKNSAFPPVPACMGEKRPVS